MSAPSSGPVPGALRRRPLARLAVTLAAPILVGLASRLPLPGVDRHVAGDYGVLVGVLALGLGPLVSGFVLVELAALAVPAWRPLRVGGRTGRATLATAAIGLGLALAAIQARGVVQHLVSSGGLSDGTLPRALAGLTLVAGTAVLVWVASFVGRHGLANGYATLLAAGGLGSTFAGISGALRFAHATQGGESGGMLVFRLALVALTVIVLVGVLIANDTLTANSGERPRLRHPASGLVPLTIAYPLLLLPVTLSAWIPALRGPGKALGGEPLFHGLLFLLAVALSLLLARLFNRPAKVAEVWSRLPGAPPDAADRESSASAALRVARIRAATLIGLVALASAIVARTMLSVLTPLAFGAAAVADAIGEWRARRAWPDLVSAWPDPRLYAVDAALAALSGAGIPAFARGVHYRTLGQFFVPYVPAEVLVPAGRVAEAEAILRRVLTGEGAPVDRPSASA